MLSVWSAADPLCIKDGQLSQTVFDTALCLGGKQYPLVSLYGAAQHPRRKEEAGTDDSNCHTMSTCHSHVQPRQPGGKDTNKYAYAKLYLLLTPKSITGVALMSDNYVV